MKFLLDTHAWIWWHINPSRLSEKVLQLIADSDNYSELLLSAISPWEFSKLLEKKRIGISCIPEAWLRQALDMSKFHLIEISPLIATIPEACRHLFIMIPVTNGTTLRFCLH